MVKPVGALVVPRCGGHERKAEYGSDRRSEEQVLAVANSISLTKSEIQPQNAFVYTFTW